MSKLISLHDEARAKLITGVRLMSEVVSTTLGARGRNVAIDEGYRFVVLHDGVSCAKAVESKDLVENLGIKIMREAAERQLSSCGDGTTGTIILAEAIILEANKIIAAGINPMSLRKGLEDGLEKLIAELDSISVPVKGLGVVDVAAISAGDKELGELVANTLTDSDRIVTVEESGAAETIVEFQEGMQFDKGFVSPYFVTEPDKAEATVENCGIIVTDIPITDANQIKGLFEEHLKTNKSVVVIAPSFGGTALPSCIITKMNGGMNILLVNAPLFGDMQKSVLEDIAVLTGSTFISGSIGMTLESSTTADIGHADRVTSTKLATLIVGGKGAKKAIKDRVSSIRIQLKGTKDNWEAAKLKERIAKLTSGVAVIKVGGTTEVEMKERKERVLDAVAATQAAIKEGIVAGGEITYIAITDVLGHSMADIILKQALYKPFEKLMENGGFNAGTMLTKITANQGIDVTTGEPMDMILNGIIDPTLVLKNALRNAVSVAIQVITCDCAIITEPEKK